MKKRKLKLSDLRVNSFVTEQKAEIKGGLKLTDGVPCYKPEPVYTDDCALTEWDCVKSMDYFCEYNK
ncbi:MAG: pinensin family lanthipeptide [Cyclobacteriaceae bacterium]